jgi:hypothetical protein
MAIYYTYLIGWSNHNKWYYGVRYSKDANPDELWKRYFTSSKVVKYFMEVNGDPDIIEIRKTFDSPVKARVWESKVLNRMRVSSDNKFLNITTNAAPMSPSELPREVEALRRMKISSSHKMSNRKRTSQKDSYPDSAKATISQKAKDRWSKVDRSVLSEQMKQGWKNMSQESEEARKISWKNAYDSKPLLECPHCGKAGKNRSAMNRWHFGNCSNSF